VTHHAEAARSFVTVIATSLLFFVAALAVLKLIEFGLDFRFDFEGVIQYLVDEYEAAASAVAALFEPHIRSLLTTIGDWFGWNLTLQPHWKHVFVLLGVYFFRDSRMFRKLRYYDVAIVSFVWGAIVAFFASVVAGSIAVERGDMHANFLIGATPVVAFFAYILGPTLASALSRREQSAAYLGGQVEPFWSYLSRRVWRNLIVVSVGLAILAFFLLVPGVANSLPVIGELRSPGLVLLAVLIILLAGYWLGRGYKQASRQARDKGAPFSRTFFNSGNVNLSIAMLSPFVGSAAIVLFDRLLKLAI
jgi:hypothetical protein